MSGRKRKIHLSLENLLQDVTPTLDEERPEKKRKVHLSLESLLHDIPLDDEEVCDDDDSEERFELSTADVSSGVGSILFDEFIDSLLTCKNSSVKKQNVLLKWLQMYPHEMLNVFIFFCQPSTIPKKTLFGFKHKFTTNKSPLKITLERVTNLNKIEGGILDIYIEIDTILSALNPSCQKYFMQYLSNNLKLGISIKHLINVAAKMFTISIENLFNIQTHISHVSNIISPFLQTLNNATPIIGVPFSFMKTYQFRESFNSNLNDYVFEEYIKGIRLQIHYHKEQNIFYIFNTHLRKCSTKHKIIESECLSLLHNNDTIHSFIIEVKLVDNKFLVVDMLLLNDNYIGNLGYSQRKEHIYQFCNSINAKLFLSSPLVDVDSIYSLDKTIIVTKASSIYEYGRTSKNRFLLNKLTNSPNTKSLKGVILGYKYGSGRRCIGIGSLLVGIWSKCKTKLIPCTKVSGFSDTIRYELERLLSIKTNVDPQCQYENDCDITVEPNIVIEVFFESVQPSMLYVVCLNSLSSRKGVSLKFPRFAKICYDATLNDIDSEETLYMFI